MGIPIVPTVASKERVLNYLQKLIEVYDTGIPLYDTYILITENLLKEV